MSQEPNTAGPKKSKLKLIIILGVVALIVLIVGSIAAVSFVTSLAKSGTEKLIEAATGATDVKIGTGEEGSVSFTDKDGNEFSVTESKELPKDFPVNDIKLYDGKITQTSRSRVDGKSMWNILIVTPDPIAKVTETVGNQLSQNGWEIITEHDTDDSSVRIAKNEKYQLTISGGTSVTDGETNVNYIVTTVGK